MDWVRPEQLFKNPFRIANNQCNMAVKIRQDFVSSLHSDSFQGQADRGLIYWPNHSRETLFHVFREISSLISFVYFFVQEVYPWCYFAPSWCHFGPARLPPWITSFFVYIWNDEPFDSTHRYLKKSRLFKFCFVTITIAASS